MAIRNSIPLLSCLFISLALTAACGSGQYGFARYYEACESEEPFDKQARDFSYGAVAANPDEYQEQLIAWFGIVQKVEATQDGRYRVRMSHNQHKDRHLCGDDTNSSCRVTVHYKSSGGFSAILSLRAEDVVPGLDKVQPGTLMRVFGRVRCRQNDDEQTECDYDEKGGILLEGVYYRQWPARYYVTTRAASSLRR